MPVGVGVLLGDRRAAYAIGAARTLARLDPSALPESMASLISHMLADLPNLPNHPGSLSLGNMLLDLVDLRGQELTSEQDQALAAYAIANILPLLDDASALQRGPLDPVVTYEAVRVARRAGVAVPESEALVARLDRYRIPGGWITAVIPVPDPASTYHALAIARALSYQGYDVERVARYLRQHLRTQDGRLSLQEAYASAMGLEILGQALQAEESAEAEAAALAEVGRLAPDPQGLDELLWFALLARRLGWELPQRVRGLLAQAAQAAPGVAEAGRVEELHRMALLEHLLREGSSPEPAIVQRILSLRSEQGGFRASPEAPVADLHSTFLALEALWYAGGIGEVDRNEISSFVLSCRDDLGFN